MSSPRELLRPDTGVFIKDDFVSNDSVADAALGELDWELVTIGNASTLSLEVTQGKNNYGVLRFTTANTADGDGEVIRLLTDGLLVVPGVEFGFKARYPDITGNQLAGNNFRIGLQDSVTASSPTVGVWVDSNAGVLTLESDSADHGDESHTVTGHPDLTSGTTMVLGDWTEFQVRCHGENAQGGPEFVDLFINDTFAGQAPCNIDDDEEVEISIAHWQDTGGAATLELDIDYIWLWIPRTGLGN